jgi:2-oxoglutarate ferredoxin oxidoreductase subunit gamma
MLNEKLMCAGFGGQGVMSLGMLITYAGMLEKKYVSWLPSYGVEMRGGTANCTVMISEKRIGAPVIDSDASTAIVMNLPSLLKFEKDLVEDGLLLVNSSLIERKASRKEVRAYYIPCNEIALEVGNPKATNLVMLGAYIELTKVVKMESVFAALRQVFGPSKEKYMPLNEEALRRGAAMVRA